MILDRIFGYKALEARLADKDREIARLIIDINDLRDRLFIKHSLPVSGAAVTSEKGESITGYTTKKARLHDYMKAQNPIVAPNLTEAELQMLRDSSQ